MIHNPIRALVMLISVSLTLVSTPVAFTHGVEATSSSRVYSDADIVKGLMYGIGPVAQSIGIQNTLPQEVSESSYERAVNNSASEMIKKYPREIALAAEDIRSGNPVDTEEGMDALTAVAQAYASEKLPNHTDFNELASPCGVAVVCVAYAAAVVHNTVIVTGLVAVVIGGALWAGVWLWTGSKKVPQASREALVIDIVDTIGNPRVDKKA